MQLPDGRTLVVDEGVLTEAASGDGRLVLWLPGERVGGFQHWDRIGIASGARVAAAEGVSFVAAVLTPTQQRSGIGLPHILRNLVRAKAEPSWTRPDGGTCARSGPRRTDIVLAWTPDERGALDEARIQRRWPTAQAARRIGPNLYLVLGVEPDPARTKTESTVAPELPPVIPGSQLAADALAEARQTGDRYREVTALIDLAVSYLNKLDAQSAAPLLEEALLGARWLGDRSRELDALVNLAQAAVILERPEQAIEWLGPALASARANGDHYTEKVALERLALAYQKQADHVQALEYFEQALALARHLGDAQHVAMLLWYSGTAHAELDRPERALARGEEAVDLLRRLRKPQADEYAQLLTDYRSKLALAAPAFAAGGIFDATVITTTPQPQAVAVAGPSILRMALTATKAAAAFVGSGFKTVSLDDYQARLATCSQCEMFTGVRCRACGCISAAKARLPHEHCPAGKWPA